MAPIQQAERLDDDREKDVVRLDDKYPSSLQCKRVFSTLDDRPVSPVPSLGSETSDDDTSSEADSADDSLLRPPQTKRRRLPRRVSFDVDKNDKPKTTCFNIKQHSEDVNHDIWWSKSDLKRIMKREGRLVINLKINTEGTDTIAASLKKSINEAFKKCLKAPLQQSPAAILEFIQDEDDTPSSTTTTTRGLERYIAPIMSAHREMVVKSLLTTQQQLSHYDPNIRMDILSTRYQHMSKIATNFAIVMGNCDAAQAAAHSSSLHNSS